MTENSQEVITISVETMKEIAAFIRHVRFQARYLWQSCEEISAELTAEGIALPEYAEELLEDVNTRSDAMAEEAQRLASSLEEAPSC